MVRTGQVFLPGPLQELFHLVYIVAFRIQKLLGKGTHFLIPLI